MTVGDATLDLPPVSPDGETPPKKATEYEIPPVLEYQEWVRDTPAGNDREEMELHNHECRGHNLEDLTLYKLLGEGVGWTIEDINEEFHPYRSDVFTDQYTKQNAREPSHHCHGSHAEGRPPVDPPTRGTIVHCSRGGPATVIQRHLHVSRGPNTGVPSSRQRGTATRSRAFGTAVRETILRSPDT